MGKFPSPFQGFAGAILSEMLARPAQASPGGTSESSLINNTTMIVRQLWSLPLRLGFCLVALGLLISHANASYGDRLPEYQQCVEV